MAYRVTVVALDEDDRPLPGIQIQWSARPVAIVEGDSLTGEAGEASASWRPETDGVSVLRAEVPGAPTLRLMVIDSASRIVPGLDPRTPVDTVLATLRSGVSLRVVDSAGRPASGIPVQLLLRPGNGAVAANYLVSDSNGRVQTDWRLESRTGLYLLEARVTGTRQDQAYTLVNARGSNRATGALLELQSFAIPATQVSLVADQDSITFDAIGQLIPVHAYGYDAYRNALLNPAFEIGIADTTIVGLDNGILQSRSPGVTRVGLRSGVAIDSIVVAVAARPVTLDLSAESTTLNWLGSSLRINALVRDRLGNIISQPAVDLSVADDGVLGLGPDGLVQAVKVGHGMVVGRIGTLADTLRVEVRQVPAFIQGRAVDTMELGELRTLQAAVLDSGNAVIPDAPVVATVDDSNLVMLLPGLEVAARLPGETRVQLRSGAAALAQRVTIEGVAVLVDGARVTEGTDISRARMVELTNGRIRIVWGPASSERGAFVMDTRIGDEWVPANVRNAGDWLYVTSTVLTEPTGIWFQAPSIDEVAVTMRFDNHRFDPVRHQYPPEYQNEPFPFARTVWLRRGEFGYYSWTELDRMMQWVGTELEVGFGGMFGPARIRTANVDFETADMVGHNRFNVEYRPEAAEFDLYGDPLMRVLVPLPEAPMISPVFPGWGFGSVYVHRADYQSYGAYLYAAPRELARPARELCQEAWTRAPFALRTLTPEEMSHCGPE